jgi:hypothetical protein
LQLSKSEKSQVSMVGPRTLSDDELLNRLERAAFDYFLINYNPANGLIADTSRTGSPSSVAVVGFALSAYPVAVERGWMTREAAVERTLVALRFFSNSPQGAMVARLVPESAPAEPSSH